MTSLRLLQKLLGFDSLLGQSFELMLPIYNPVTRSSSPSSFIHFTTTCRLLLLFLPFTSQPHVFFFSFFSISHFTSLFSPVSRPFLKMGQPRPLLHLFLSICSDHFSSQSDSNSSCRSRRQGC